MSQVVIILEDRDEFGKVTATINRCFDDYDETDTPAINLGNKAFELIKANLD